MWGVTHSLPLLEQPEILSGRTRIRRINERLHVVV
jgi:hypothetical protein